MRERVVITCLVSSSLKLEDVGVLLPGSGSTAAVFRSTADASQDVASALRKGWISVRSLPEAPRRPLSDVVRDMPVWPFSRPRDAAPAANPVLAVLMSIEGKLSELLQRPSAAPPEVVAAHVKAISSMARMPAGLPGGGPLPGPGVSEEPQFIPSKIIPDAAETSINVREGVVLADVDSAASELRKLRKK